LLENCVFYILRMYEFLHRVGQTEKGSERASVFRSAPESGLHALMSTRLNSTRRDFAMTKILLIRHGHVEGIKPERFRGRADLPLTERGDAEAHAVAQRIAAAWHPAKIYTSPMGRCVATGAAISRACKVTVEVCDDFNDIHYGAWQLRSYEEMRSQDPERFAAWFATPHLVRFPDGESLADLVRRTSKALQLVFSRHVHDTVVIVAHDSVNRAILLQLLGAPPSAYWRLAQEPCCINEIDIVGEQIRVVRMNDTCHLTDTG
jgi:phosphoserine phosphatase